MMDDLAVSGGLQSRFFPGNAGFQPANEFVGILPVQGSATSAQAGSLRSQGLCNPPAGGLPSRRPPLVFSKKYSTTSGVPVLILRGNSQKGY